MPSVHAMITDISDVNGVQQGEAVNGFEVLAVRSLTVPVVLLATATSTINEAVPYKSHAPYS